MWQRSCHAPRPCIGVVAERLCHPPSPYSPATRHYTVPSESKKGAPLSIAAKVSPQGSGLQPQGQFLTPHPTPVFVQKVPACKVGQEGVALDSVPAGLFPFPFGIASPSRDRRRKRGAKLLCCLGWDGQGGGKSLGDLLKRRQRGH